METTEFLSALVDIHNNLTEINVRGDDAIRMAEILRKCRGIVFTLQKELSEKSEKPDSKGE